MQINSKTALVIIDVQQGFDDGRWGERNNPEAEENVARLLSAWRRAELPIIHVQHDSTAVTGAFHPGSPGHAPKKQAQPLDGEPVYHKTVNSAFIGTTLDADLRSKEIDALVMVGLTTNHCVSTTTRMAGNMGYRTAIVSDATASFAREHINGGMRSAEEVHLGALSDLKDEFAEVTDTETLLNVVLGHLDR